MMINGKKLTDLTIAQAEQVLKEAQTGPQVSFIGGTNRTKGEGLGGGTQQD